MKIIPITKRNSAQAAEIADSIFPKCEVAPGQAFIASLSPENFEEYKKKFPHLLSLRYWLAVDDKDDDVVMGNIGLYELDYDSDVAAWLGWFCVAPEHRRKGVGSALLDFAISRAREMGKQYLRLYTTDAPEEADAQVLYEGKGLKIAGLNHPEIKSEHTVIFRELML